ncbi:MAG: CPBP family intramembrane glutamic endopeptidase [Polyangiales bacterium]
MSLTSPRDRHRAFWGAGVALLIVSGIGAFAQVRRLDAAEKKYDLGAVVPTAWSRRPDGQMGFAAGPEIALPARPSVRVRACAAGPSAADLQLEISDARSRRVIARERLTVSHALTRRCVDAEWRGAPAVAVRASLVSKGLPPAITELEVRAGGTIRPVDILPSLGVVLALALLIFAPRLSRAPGDETPDELPPVESLPHASRGYLGLALAVGALVSANVLAQVPVLRGGVRGTTLLASLGLQQLLLAVASAALMGAFVAPSARVAMELTTPPRGWGLRALAAAVGLLSIAVSVGLLLKDAGDSPIARAVEAMPVRYVIAFGAVCAPLPEELFFRGLLGRIFASIVGARRVAVVIALSAAVFTAMHAMQLTNARLGLVPIAALGLVNGWLRWKNRGLAVPWAVHTLYNATLALSALA